MPQSYGIALNTFGTADPHRQSSAPTPRPIGAMMWTRDVQNKFYSRFVKAIRDAGYRGPLCGSPWQAPAMLPHYYNLRSDYLVGYIDRHNYFGGGLFDSLLAQPGTGYFSSGLQQVANRPFGLSEWITVYPSLYSADGPALIAAYGLGLQGWDASYEFQSQSAHRLFSDRAGRPPDPAWPLPCLGPHDLSRRRERSPRHFHPLRQPGKPRYRHIQLRRQSRPAR